MLSGAAGKASRSEKGIWLHAPVSALCLFRDKCCFQVIYFNPNFSFVPFIKVRVAAGVETVRLRDAVKNACVRPENRAFGAILPDRAPLRGV